MNPAEPDAHLRAALRHAPDAAVQAPTELSALIVAAAHRAAAQRPPHAAPARRSGWHWGGTWRLGATGAFASLLMAGVIGLLWRDEPPGPIAEAPATQAVAPTPMPDTRVEPAPAPKPVQPAKPALPAARSAPAPLSAPAAEAATTTALAPPPPPVPMPSPAKAAPVVAAALPAAVPAASLTLSGSRAAVDAATGEAAAGSRSRTLASADGLARQAAQWAVPWTSALTEGAVSKQQLGAAQASDAAWLQNLTRQTAGRWQVDANAQPETAEPLMEWHLGDRLLGRLWLGEARALWCPAPGVQAPCQVAALPASALSELKEKRPR